MIKLIRNRRAARRQAQVEYLQMVAALELKVRMAMYRQGLELPR